jgi:hypothetical protein
MNHDGFRSLLRRRPFQPFGVLVGDGRNDEVRDPYM